MRGRRTRVWLALGLVVLAVAALAVGFGPRISSELSWRLSERGPSYRGPPGEVGVAWEAGLLSPDGDRLAVRFPGRAEGGDQPCGAFYIGLVGATLAGLRVTIITIPGAGPPAGGCPTGARSTDRCAEVRLPYPPAERPVLDGVGGTAPPLATAAGAGELGAGELCDQLLDG